MIWLFISVLLVFAGSAEATARFMAENGQTSGTCTTSGTACRFDFLVSVLACGDTVTILNGDGVYTGANNMINTDAAFGGTTPAAPTCTAGNTIAFSAETDGGVFFNGEFSRAPAIFKGLTYWTFTGFDIGNADAAGQNLVVAMSTLNHVTFQRICASNVGPVSTTWTAAQSNVHVWGFYGSVDNTIWEDICGFGSGRNTFVDGANGSGNVLRRVWLRHEGWCPASGSSDAGRYTFQAPYYSDTLPPTNGNTTYENLIIVYGPEQQTTCGTSDHGAVGAGVWGRTSSLTINYRGLIIYSRPGFTTANAGLSQHPFLYDSHNVSGAAYTRTYVDAFVDRREQPGNGLGASKAIMLDCRSGSNCNSNTASRMTAIMASDNEPSTYVGWTATNANECTATGSCPNFYTGDTPGTGSRACFRYVDGTLTSTPLWPWPMDDRIKAALARANAAGTGGTALTGSAGSGYAANTVTSEIVSKYGSIPTACLTSSSFTPSFPVASDFPSVTVRDDFDRVDSGTLGAGWTELLSDTFSIVSHAAAAPSGGGGFARSLYSDTKMQTSHEVYATWTTLAAPGGYATFLSFAGTDLTANNQYRVVINQTSGSNTLLKVQRIDGVGTATDILSAVDLGIEAVAGNSFGVRVSGTTISVYWKWTDGIWYRVGEFTDSNLSTLPSTGVYGGIAGGSPSVIDNYGAGPFVDQPVQEPPAPPASVGAGRFGTTFPGVR